MELVKLEKQRKNYQSAKNVFILLGKMCLILAPLLSFIGWALPHDSWADFLQFNFSRTATDATTNIDRDNLNQVFRFYYLPHYFIYASMLFYAGLGIYLAYLLYKTKPWYALIGSMMMVVGVIYFVGVLGAFLSIPIGTVNHTNILKISFGLSTFVFLGNIILGIGLFKSQILAKRNVIFFILGIALIVIFPGMENWMAIGSLCILISLLPLSIFLKK